MKEEHTRVYGIGKHEDKYISFEADPEVLLHDYDKYEKYVKGCEHTVRNDDRYKAYVASVHEAGFNHCAILGEIDRGGDKVKLEMHHGPIFNLFDICDIVLKACLKRGMQNITTFDIGDLVLTEHELGNVMFVMLSKTGHKGAHNNIFIDIKATGGRLDRFIERWYDGMERNHFEYIERYIEACKKADGNSTDQGLFDVADQMKRFKKKKKKEDGAE